MIITLFGPPGSGKGTQGTLLSEHLHIPHLSTGDMLRDTAASGTTLGRRIAETLAEGHYMDDALVCDMVAERTAKGDCASGFILDGFPRTLSQAKTLDHMLLARRRRIDAAILIDVSDASITTRIAARAAEADAPRADDAPEVIPERLRIYRETMLPVLDAYTRQGRLLRVDGEATRDEVFSAILHRAGLSLTLL